MALLTGRLVHMYKAWGMMPCAKKPTSQHMEAWGLVFSICTFVDHLAQPVAQASLTHHCD